MRKSHGGGSHRKRSSGGQIQRGIGQLHAWAKGRTKLELIVHGEVCQSRYLGKVTDISISGVPAFEFVGHGVKVRLLPDSWSRACLIPAGEKAALEVYGKRGNESFAIEEFQRHGPDTVSFRKVLDQLTSWSTMKAELSVSFSIGPCIPSFVSRIKVIEPSGVFSFFGNRSSLLVDIREYDTMNVELQDQHTVVFLIDSARRGACLRISDAPMDDAQVLEQFQSGTA
jgi:hypothetical protein